MDTTSSKQLLALLIMPDGNKSKPKSSSGKGNLSVKNGPQGKFSTDSKVGSRIFHRPEGAFKLMEDGSGKGHSAKEKDADGGSSSKGDLTANEKSRKASLNQSASNSLDPDKLKHAKTCNADSPGNLTSIPNQSKYGTSSTSASAIKTPKFERPQSGDSQATNRSHIPTKVTPKELTSKVKVNQSKINRACGIKSSKSSESKEKSSKSKISKASSTKEIGSGYKLNSASNELSLSKTREEVNKSTSKSKVGFSKSKSSQVSKANSKAALDGSTYLGTGSSSNTVFSGSASHSKSIHSGTFSGHAGSSHGASKSVSQGSDSRIGASNGSNSSSSKSTSNSSAASEGTSYEKNSSKSASTSDGSNV